MSSAAGSQVRSGLVWGFSCQAVVLGSADSFLFGAGKAVFRPVACNQVPGARGRGQGTETLAESLAACRLASLVFRSALTPEHAEGRWTARRTCLHSFQCWPVPVIGLLRIRGELAIEGTSSCHRQTCMR